MYAQGNKLTAIAIMFIHARSILHVYMFILLHSYSTKLKRGKKEGGEKGVEMGEREENGEII